jgi:hypothetical protein
MDAVQRQRRIEQLLRMRLEGNFGVDESAEYHRLTEEERLALVSHGEPRRCGADA